MPADKKNAKAIATLTQEAAAELQHVCILLRDALEFAEDDYPHNDDKLRDVYGALRLAQSVVVQEHHTWHDYARHRES